MHRLEVLNAAMQAFSDPTWAESDPSTVLIQRLKQSPFFTAIRGKIVSSRKKYLQTNYTLLSHGGGSGDGIEVEEKGKSQGAEPGQELSLSSKAAKCSDEAAMEFRQLRALESQAEVRFFK